MWCRVSIVISEKPAASILRTDACAIRSFTLSITPPTFAGRVTCNITELRKNKGRSRVSSYLASNSATPGFKYKLGDWLSWWIFCNYPPENAGIMPCIRPRRPSSLSSILFNHPIIWHYTLWATGSYVKCTTNKRQVRECKQSEHSGTFVLSLPLDIHLVNSNYGYSLTRGEDDRTGIKSSSPANPYLACCVKCGL
jgi:hypothetical protein